MGPLNFRWTSSRPTRLWLKMPGPIRVGQVELLFANWLGDSRSYRESIG